MTGFNLMILAAGYGKRMNKLTHSIPKPLLKINNKELLRHNIDFFTNLGCNKIIINTHYLHDKIQHCIERYYATFCMHTDTNKDKQILLRFTERFSFLLEIYSYFIPVHAFL